MSGSRNRRSLRFAQSVEGRGTGSAGTARGAAQRFVEGFLGLKQPPLTGFKRKHKELAHAPPQCDGNRFEVTPSPLLGFSCLHRSPAKQKCLRLKHIVATELQCDCSGAHQRLLLVVRKNSYSPDTRLSLNFRLSWW